MISYNITELSFLPPSYIPMAIAELKQNFSSKIRRAAVTDLQIVKPSSLCVDKDMMTSSQKRPTTVKKKRIKKL